jgi:hypothetical protein
MLCALNSDPDGSSQVLWEDGERTILPRLADRP